MIAEYDLVDWRDPTYNGKDINRICTPKLQDYYRGILRYKTSDINTDDSDDSEMVIVTETTENSSTKGCDED